MKITLGFADPWDNSVDEQQLDDIYPSHIGGKPIWISGEKLINGADVKCEKCEKQMWFMLQLYAPDNLHKHSYHRLIHVFICPNNNCKNSKAFRSNAPDSSSFKDDDWSRKMCAVCGVGGGHVCGKCHKTAYCSREHQILDWKSGGHSIKCLADRSDDATGTQNDDNDGVGKFKRFLISHEPEDDLEIEEVVEAAGALSKNCLKLDVEESTDEKWAEEEFEEATSEVDKQFLRFQKKIRFQPDQILRYYRSDEAPVDAEIEPLWVSEQGRITDASTQIPKCQYCRSARTCEFQILPQTLNHLTVDHSEKNSLDFGTIFVYSCSNDCRLDAFVSAEFTWWQDFSSDGVGLDLKQPQQQ